MVPASAARGRPARERRPASGLPTVDDTPALPRRGGFGVSGALDRAGNFAGASRALAHAVGVPAAALIGTSAYSLIHPNDTQRARTSLTALWNGTPTRAFRARVWTADGDWRGVEISASLVTRTAGQTEAVFQIRPLESIHPSGNAAATALPAGPGPRGAIVWDLAFNVVSWNEGATALFGYAEVEIRGKPALEVLAKPSARADVAELRHLLLTQRAGTTFAADAVTKDGRTIACEWCHAPVLDADGKPAGFASSVVSIGGPAREERRAPLRDALTGVPSTAVFMDRLERAVTSAARAKTDVAVLLLDLDNFAIVNGAIGHRCGDALLRAVAGRLSRALRDADSIARLGGDKFLVLAPNVGGEGGASALALRMLNCFAEPFCIDEHRLVQSASIGIGIFPDDAGDADGLVSCADVAMSAAKELGRDVFAFFGATAGGPDRISLERDLRLAVDRDELELHFQPQIDLRTGELCGAEALVRWRHPVRGLLMPSDFVALAEETGLIVPIGGWVLRTACAAMRAWNEAGIGVPRVTINVSGRELRRRFVDDVAQVLCDTDVDPNSLEIELTETVTMRSGETPPQLLDELKSFGVRIAVDDFGVGYSSLTYLQRFPLDTLKIDRMFVGDCLTNRVNAGIVRGIVTMARGMELDVVAEGVESRDQADFLKELGCEIAQGYFFSRPLPLDEFARFVSSHTTGSATT